MRSHTMTKTLLAVPSEMPGGLDARISEHFGHCALYTIIEVENGAATTVNTLPNVPHVQGGCMAPVNHLAQHGVTALIAGGMGMRPLMGFKQAGIEVYYGAGVANVGEAVAAFVQGGLKQFSTDFTCGGGC
jgi:predicted Fe-Mo cluster-binding NifX family protein